MKKLIFKYLSIKSISRIRHVVNYFKKKRLQHLIYSDSKDKKYLSMDDLERMNNEYEPPERYGYDIETLHKRGQDRSETLVKLTKHDPNINKTLEIGAQDGIVSYYLNKKYNKTSTCLDLDPEPIEGLAYDNIQFVTGDVGQLPFENDSFDLVFSFNAFEHFHDPKEALLEMLRIVRPGGIVYLDFGPLYNAPKGLHLYYKVHIPYCQLLFEHKTLEEYCLIHNLGKPNFKINDGLNGWSIEQYRALWNEVKPLAVIEKYFEKPTYTHLDMVYTYPEYFKGKFESIDDLIITQIQIKLKKKTNK